MGKYGSVREGQKAPRKWKVHPIWRGIGLFMMILIPIMAYAGSVEFINYNMRSQVIPIPSRMYQPTGFVGVTVEEAGNAKYGIVVRERLGVVVFTGVFMGVGFGLFTMIYAFIYRIIAPPRYQGYDVPPVGKYRPRTDQGTVRRRH
jgi:hypothetical protein